MVRPTVALYANPDGLSLRLVESLLSNFCFVKIVSEDENFFQKSLSHISQKNLFQVVSLEKEKGLANFDYLILSDLDLAFDLSEILAICRLARAQSAKILVVLPFCVESAKKWQQREKIRGLIFKKVPGAGIVYAGDVFGSRYFGEDKNFLARNISKAVSQVAVESSEGTALYPIPIETLCRYLVRSMFSFGPYGKEVAIYSQEIPWSECLHALSKAVGEVSFESAKRAVERQEVLGIKHVLVRSDFERNLRETILWFGKNTERKDKRKDNLHFLKKGALMGIAVLLLAPPFLVFLTSAGLFLSFRAARNGEMDSAEKSLSHSKFTAQNSQKFFYVYGGIPLVSKIYRPLAFFSHILASASEIGFDGIKIAQKSRELANFVLGDNVYDPTSMTQEIAVGLDELYEKISFLQGEIRGASGATRKMVARFASESDLESVREKILSAKTLAEELPEILGRDTPKTYLVLFQNNMELRPAGGFIGSFALVSFDAGRLIDISVSDVYAADGQLKGHVEPPAPIKKYLGEANWFLRDSNWDPDFPTSAARAQWFLDKEIDRKVDGVIGLDLEVAKGILQVTGPVVLADFNQAFDYQNLYERLQSEVEADFFPGSQKKASVLTALARELMNRLSSLKEDKYLPLARQIFQNLEERHLQIYFNNAGVQEAVSRLGYSGEMAVPVCFENCFADWLAAVDANVGVTKANYFVKREFKVDVTVSEGVAQKTLAITYQNTANPALGLSGRYKTYTRIFVPTESAFQKIKIENAGVVVETDPEIENLWDKKSGGVNVEISPAQTKKLIFSWETPLPQNLTVGGYQLYIRKQSGTLTDPLSVNILTPEEVKSYNTDLGRDFLARILLR